jgi:hypothetical protein
MVSFLFLFCLARALICILPPPLLSPQKKIVKKNPSCKVYSARLAEKDKKGQKKN